MRTYLHFILKKVIAYLSYSFRPMAFKFKKKTFLFFVSFIFFSTIFGTSLRLYAHTSTAENGIAPILQDLFEITGQISDQNNQPIAGVTIRLKDRTNIQTSTDQNGRFVIAVPNEFRDSGVLIFTNIGYTEQEVVINSQQRITLQMDEATTLIGETVPEKFMNSRQL